MFRFPKKQKHPKCIAFVDFEHWYIGLERQYGVKPDLKGWKEELMTKYEVDEIAVFGDFSNIGLRGELDKIRDITQMVFDTKNSSEHYKKDFTDFILLDYIYQKAMTRRGTSVSAAWVGVRVSSVNWVIGPRCRMTRGPWTPPLASVVITHHPKKLGEGAAGPPRAEPHPCKRGCPCPRDLSRMDGLW